MAVYTILSVDVVPECAAGKQHVAKASLMVERSPAGVAPIARLLRLEADGARFVADNGEDSGAETTLNLVLCACSLGYLLQPEGLVEAYPTHG